MSDNRIVKVGDTVEFINPINGARLRDKVAYVDARTIEGQVYDLSHVSLFIVATAEESKVITNQK
jgi:hypothetical protein